MNLKLQYSHEKYLRVETGLDVSNSFLSTPKRCSQNQAPSLLPVSPMYKCFHKISALYAMNDNICINNKNLIQRAKLLNAYLS